MKIKRRYSCVVCDGPVEKPPCRKTTENETGAGLGHWYCAGKCKGKTKVKVELIERK